MYKNIEVYFFILAHMLYQGRGADSIWHYTNRSPHYRKHQENGGEDGENEGGGKGDHKRMVK